MYDAIGKTIEHEIDLLGTLPKEERPEKTLCVILTDGEENSSQAFTKGQIKEMVEEMKEDFNWEFIFLAANRDAFATGGQLGINAGDTFNFASTGVGTRTAYGNMGKTVSQYRTGVDTSEDHQQD